MIHSYNKVDYSRKTFGIHLAFIKDSAVVNNIEIIRDFHTRLLSSGNLTTHPAVETSTVQGGCGLMSISGLSVLLSSSTELVLYMGL